MTLSQAEIRIADLEHENRTLKAALGLGARFPAIFQFTKREQAILGVLVTRKVMTIDMAIMAVYGDCVDGGPDGIKKVIQVNMHVLRKKLKRFGVKVSTVYGMGYEIDEHSQKMLRAAMIKDA